jgi:hypothetical protein
VGVGLGVGVGVGVGGGGRCRSTWRLSIRRHKVDNAQFHQQSIIRDRRGPAALPIRNGCEGGEGGI